MHRVLGVLLLGCAACGPAASGQGSQAQEPGIRFHTAVQEVALDLVVRDSHGRQVKDLKPEEVAIHEDGVRQEVRSFRLVTGREVLQPRAGKTAAPQPGLPASPLPAVNLVCVVFHNIDLRDPEVMRFVQKAVHEFLDRDFQAGTAVAFFSLGNRLTVLRGFTSDRKELEGLLASSFRAPIAPFSRISEAVLNATPYEATVTVSSTGAVTVSIIGGEVSLRAITSAEVGTSQGEQVLRGLRADQRRAFGRISAMEQWDQMKLLVNELAPLPGRKSVLLLSGGFPTSGDAALFQKLLDWANQGQVSIYGVDVNGLSTTSSVQAANLTLSRAATLSRTQGSLGGTVGENMERMRQTDYMWMAVRAADGLRALSEGTGGFVIANTDDLRKPFQRVLEDVDTHYEAVYRPSSKKYDGRLRKIEVKLARANVNVQSRTGYFALPALADSGPLTLPEMVGLAALNAGERPHAFDFQSAEYQFRPAPGGSHCVLAFELPVEHLAATALPEAKRHRVRVSLLALVKDSAGQVVDKFSQNASFEVPDEQLEAVRKSAIPFTHALELPAGRYTVETAVFDREADRASVSQLPFENPEAKGLALSSVMLVHELQTFNGKADSSDPLQFPISATQARRVLPALSTTLSAGAEPFVYFVVYPDPATADKPKLEVEVTSGGQVLQKQTAELRPRATGFIPMVVKVPPHAGKCEFKVTAVQGRASAKRSLAYSIGGD